MGYDDAAKGVKGEKGVDGVDGITRIVYTDEHMGNIQVATNGRRHALRWRYWHCNQEKT